MITRTRARHQAAPDTPFNNDAIEAGAVSGSADMAMGRIVDPPDNLVVQHLMDDGLACVVRARHPEIRDGISRKQYRTLKHVNVILPGGLRAGLLEAPSQKGLNREVALSVTHFVAVPEMTAVTA
jgi:DNA-binding transcriptional LysR family regulator